MSCNRRKRAGFTLVEQIIVIALMVVMVGFGAVRMMQVYEQNSEEHAAKSLVSVLRFLQMKSVEEGRIYELSISENQKKILVKRQKKNSKDFEPVRSAWLQAVEIGKSLTFQLERDKNLLFYPDGSASKNRLLLTKKTGERTILELKNRIGTVDVTHG